jgi:hypothetical protein
MVRDDSNTLYINTFCDILREQRINREGWTSAEFLLLEELARKNIHACSIARKLGRSIYSVQVAAAYRGVSVKPFS